MMRGATQVPLSFARASRLSRVARCLGAIAAIALTAGASSAAAESSAAHSIEGVWFFNGGRVAIQLGPDGTFVGTVVSPTRFDECDHEVGERMWTGIAAQADGSYWGLHQWFSGDGKCARQPIRGRTAWRVLRTQVGARYLRVCLSEPGTEGQPVIEPDGEALDTNYGCADSALISSETAGHLSQYARLPRAKGCLPAKAKLRVRISNWANDPLTRILVTLRQGDIRRRAKIRHSGERTFAVLSLKGLLAGRFMVRVELDTVLGNHLSGKRTYVRCGTKRKRRRGLHPQPSGARRPFLRA